MTTLAQEHQEVFIRKLTALADDEIILAHRGSEWTGHAPILEEDIALANIAQDELGHATLYLGLRSALDGSDADQLAFFREAREFTNTQLVEFPKGDWAFTMVRQYLYDAFEALWLEQAQNSSYAPLAEVAVKAFREERFHLQHTALWVERLALGTAESLRRTQNALNELWPYTFQLFEPVAGEEALVEAGIVPDLQIIQTRWESLVKNHLVDTCALSLPIKTSQVIARSEHTEHLTELLTEMQSVARKYPSAEVW